jgi:hypothetical protein
MRATFAEAGEVRDGIELYRCSTSGRHFLHFPPSTFLWVEAPCLDHPDVCHRDRDRFTLWCCDPTRINGGEIRFTPSASHQPRLVLAHLSRSLITFGPNFPEPENYSLAIGPNLCTRGRYWESGHHEVTVGNNGHSLVDRDYWVLTTMVPGDKIKARFSLCGGPKQRTFAYADGEAVVCEPDGSVSMNRLLARPY